jgi:cytochrome c
MTTARLTVPRSATARRPWVRTCLATLTLAAATAAQADNRDDAMLKLANASGCMTCHHIDPGAKGPDGLAPVGPAWREVAAKYKGQKDAQATLTHTVLAGSNPYASHWKGKVSGLAMPPNKVAITDDKARQLVKWILALDAAKKP